MKPLHESILGNPDEIAPDVKILKPKDWINWKCHNRLRQSVGEWNIKLLYPLVLKRIQNDLEWFNGLVDKSVPMYNQWDVMIRNSFLHQYDNIEEDGRRKTKFVHPFKSPLPLLVAIHEYFYDNAQVYAIQSNDKTLTCGGGDEKTLLMHSAGSTPEDIDVIYKHAQETVKKFNSKIKKYTFWSTTNQHFEKFEKDAVVFPPFKNEMPHDKHSYCFNIELK